MYNLNEINNELEYSNNKNFYKENLKETIKENLKETIKKTERDSEFRIIYKEKNKEKNDDKSSKRYMFFEVFRKEHLHHLQFGTRSNVVLEDERHA